MGNVLGGCLIVIGGILLVLLVVGCMFGTDVYTCGQKWPDIQHRYEIGAGCQVLTDEAGWIPDYRYRNIE